VETIRSLEGLIDVYLPDFKYMENRLAGELSDAPDYPQVALAALKEMYRQKGSSLLTDEEDGVVSGMIVRHLVLPGHVSNSLNVIRTIAGELSPRIHISLMSQYHPNSKVRRLGPLAGTLRSPEYGEVMEELDRLGMQRGWIQDFDSNNYYLPDFEKEHPFESG
jgi:putative pyruvate formate lyase activating enzyme